MNSLKNAQLMNEISPTGKPMRYLLSEGKIFASARSWSSALKVPSNMRDWFESGLGRVAIMKKITLVEALKEVIKVLPFIDGLQ